MASFAESLGKGWQAGERRTIHRRPYVRRKPIPGRPSMLSPYASQIGAWLAAEPHLTAVAILDRLSEAAPDRFSGKQHRTLQRFVKSWRTKTAKLLIDGTETMLTIEGPVAVPAGTATGPYAASADDAPR